MHSFEIAIAPTKIDRLVAPIILNCNRSISNENLQSFKRISAQRVVQKI